MIEPDCAALRQRMVADIAAQTIFLTGRLGKAALDRRVQNVMPKVPRHEYVRLAARAAAPFAYDEWRGEVASWRRPCDRTKSSK